MVVRTVLILCAIGLVGVFPSTVFSQDGQPNQPNGAFEEPVGGSDISNQFIVHLRSGRRSARHIGQKIAERVGAIRLRTMRHRAQVVLMEKLARRNARQFRKSLENDPDVLRVEPNAPVSIPDPHPNEINTFSSFGSISEEGTANALSADDPYLTWGYRDIQAHLAPNELDSAPMVAVIDTGVDFTHPELSGRIVAGYDYHNDDSDPMDDHGHGTHVSGIIAAEAGNGLGSAGISTQSRILAIKVLGANGSGSTWNVIQGIYEAADHRDVRVINLSLGTWVGTWSFHNAVDYAVAKGKLIVAAAGNSNTDSPYFPAFWSQYSDGVVAVAANTRDGCKAYFSNYGYWVTIAAPGKDILSTLPGNSYGSWSGTSMAAPFVAGAAARVLSINSGLGVGELAATMENTSDHMSFNGACWPAEGSDFGHLNLYASLGIIEAPNDSEPPVIVISEPNPNILQTTDQESIDIFGTASDNMAVVQVTWASDRGASGMAQGTDSWEIAGLPLSVGQNIITVSAKDAAGNQVQTSLTVDHTVSGSAPLKLQVNAGTGDSMEKIYNGFTLPAYARGYVGKGFINGFHFGQLPVPQGSQILSARLNLHSWRSGDTDIAIEYSGEASDDSTEFTNDRYDLSGRPKTETTVFDRPNTWQDDAYNSSPDLSAVLQEIVDRPGWRSGSALNLFLTDRNSSGYRRVSVFEQDPMKTAVLTIEYCLDESEPDDDDTVPPEIWITDPKADSIYYTSKQTLNLSGSAEDDTEVVEVSWESDRGGEELAQGTYEWSVDAIMLRAGTNYITVKAVDGAGNTGQVVLEVVYEPATDEEPEDEETQVLDLSLQSGKDDAYEKTNGAVSTTSRAMYIGQGHLNGFRFTDVPIPAGATVVKAGLILHTRMYGSDDVVARFTAEDSIDVEAFSIARNDLSDRSRIATQVTVSLPSWNEGEYNEGPDLSDIIQELVDRSDWQSGGVILLLVDDPENDNEKRMIHTYEMDPEFSPRLKIEYRP